MISLGFGGCRISPAVSSSACCEKERTAFSPAELSTDSAMCSREFLRCWDEEKHQLVSSRMRARGHHGFAAVAVVRQHGPKAGGREHLVIVRREAADAE